MAALDAADVTVVVEQRWISGVKRHSVGTLTIAGTDTYPTGGIPLGTTLQAGAKKFGMDRQLDVLEVVGSGDADTAANTTEYVYGYNQGAGTLVLYEEEATAAGGPLLEADTSEVPGARTVRFYAIGW